MSQELMSANIAALDELSAICSLQELLEICLEQLEGETKTPAQKQDRAVKLLVCYLEQVRLHSQTLEPELIEIKQQATGLKEPSYARLSWGGRQ